MKLRTKRSIYVLLIVALTVLLIPSASFAATKKLATPKITSVKSVDSAYMKLTWNKVKGASEYNIYRAIKKNGEYDFIKRINKTSYTDKKMYSNHHTYYYKIKAISDKKSVKNSNFSKIAKGVVKHNGSINIPNTYFEAGGENAFWIPTYVKNYSKAYYGGLDIDYDGPGLAQCSWYSKRDILSCKTKEWTPNGYDINLTVGLREHPKQKEKIKIHVLGYNDIEDYILMEAPDFGQVIGMKSVASDVTLHTITFKYHIYEDIDNVHAYSAMRSYHSLLKLNGFKITHQRDGGYDTVFTKGDQYVNVILRYVGDAYAEVTINGSTVYPF